MFPILFWFSIILNFILFFPLISAVTTNPIESNSVKFVNIGLNHSKFNGIQDITSMEWKENSFQKSSREISKNSQGNLIFYITYPNFSKNL